MSSGSASCARAVGTATISRAAAMISRRILVLGATWVREQILVAVRGQTESFTIHCSLQYIASSAWMGGPSDGETAISPVRRVIPKRGHPQQAGGDANGSRFLDLGLVACR